MLSKSSVKMSQNSHIYSMHVKYIRDAHCMLDAVQARHLFASARVPHLSKSTIASSRVAAWAAIQWRTSIPSDPSSPSISEKESHRHTSPSWSASQPTVKDLPEPWNSTQPDLTIWHLVSQVCSNISIAERKRSWLLHVSLLLAPWPPWPYSLLEHALQSKRTRLKQRRSGSFRICPSKII